MNKSTSIVISAFPGMGKTTLFRKGEHFEDGLKCYNPAKSICRYFIHDSDSSKYSWLYDFNGNKTNTRNPDFPDNYIRHIAELYDHEYTLIFVSSHENVRNALLNHGLPFCLVYPGLKDKEQFMERYRERGNDNNFLKLLDENYETWVEQLEVFAVQNQDMVRSYKTGGYLTDIIDQIIQDNVVPFV